jgi:hypothetical protein
MRLATAFVEIRVDRNKAEREAKTAAQQAFGAIRSVFAAGIAIKGIQQAIGQASDLNETISKTGVVFGNSAKDIEAWSKSSARNLGLSQRAALDAASTFAIFGKAAGLVGTDLTSFSTDLTGLASDLASFNNTTPEEAILAIGAALRGESEPIRQYGVLLDDATLKQRAMEMGLYNGVGALEQSARVLAAQKEILAQTGLAQGDFARTAEGVANKQRIANAEAENAAASFGQVLLPVYQRVLEVVTFLVRGFESLPAPLQVGVVALGALVAFSGPISTMKDLVTDLVGAFTRAGVSSAALGAAVGGVGLAIGAAVLVYQVYSQRKKEAEQRTRGLADALLGEASAQNEALAALAENDEGVKQFLVTQKDLGLSTAELAEFMRDGSGAAGELVEQWVAANEAADGIYPTLDAFREQMGLGADATYEQLALIRNFTQELERLRAGELERLATQNLVNDVTGQTAEVTEEAVVAVEDMADAQADARDRFKEATKRMDEQREAIADLYDELIGQVDAQRAYERAIDDSEQAVADFIAVQQDEESTLEDIQDASRSAADQIIESAKAYAELNAGSTTSKAGVDAMIASLYAQAVALDPSSPLRAELVAYIGELQSIPTQIDTNIRLRVTGQTITRDGDVIGVRALTGSAVASADGRYVPAGANLLSTFGERGPEAILPLDRPNRLVELLGDPRIGGPVAAAMGGGGGASVVMPVTVYSYGTEPAYIESLSKSLYSLERSKT